MKRRYLLALFAGSFFLQAFSCNNGSQGSDSNSNTSQNGTSSTDSTDQQIPSAHTQACTPACNNLSCGNDGCGGTCGTCQSNEYCSEEQQCVALAIPTHVWNVFQTNCTGCHRAPGTASKPEFSSPSQAYGMLVNHPSDACSDAMLILPNNVGASYLVAQLTSGGSLSGCNEIVHMPPRKQLTDADLQTIVDWIGTGASGE